MSVSCGGRGSGEIPARSRDRCCCLLYKSRSRPQANCKYSKAQETRKSTKASRLMQSDPTRPSMEVTVTGQCLHSNIWEGQGENRPPPSRPPQPQSPDDSSWELTAKKQTNQPKKCRSQAQFPNSLLRLQATQRRSSLWVRPRQPEFPREQQEGHLHTSRSAGPGWLSPECLSSCGHSGACILLVSFSETESHCEQGPHTSVLGAWDSTPVPLHHFTLAFAQGAVEREEETSLRLPARGQKELMKKINHPSELG